MLFIIPTVALSFLEQKLGNTVETSSTLDSEEVKPSKEAEIQSVQTDVTEPDFIKVYNTATNDVMVIDFEEYIKGVVASEMPAEFNIEALKAQAITARTYLLYRMKKYPDGQPEHKDAPICTGIHCQAWNSKETLIKSHPDGWYDTYWSKIEESVTSTRGQVLTYDGKIIEPLFHSTSGGRTENSEDVFSTSVPYLRSVESPYENDSPKLHNSIKVSTTDFIKKIQSVYGNLNLTASNLKDKIKLGEVSEGGKIKSIIIDKKEISGREMRSLFGLSSTN
jgi:stage II sporulation protein D